MSDDFNGGMTKTKQTRNRGSLFQFGGGRATDFFHLNFITAGWERFAAGKGPAVLADRRGNRKQRGIGGRTGVRRSGASGVLSWGSLILIFIAGLFLSGCQSPVHSLFSATGQGWQVHQGQALWRPRGGLPEFGGDVVLARDGAGRHLIQFDKTPMAILSAQTTSNRWLIKFPARNLSFSGFGAGPTRFAWLYLPAALEGKQLPKTLRFDRKADGSWRLENLDTGESLEGFLSP